MIEDGYSICLNKWVLDTQIKNELPLLLIISSLTAKTGECFASNKYFAMLFDCTEVSISQKINKLIKIGYISAEYEKRGAEIKKRVLRLKNFLTDDLNIFYPTIKNNFKDNNISNKNTSIKKVYISKNQDENQLEKVKRFIKPSVEEIRKYCLERKNNVDAERFFDFYESKGWKVGNQAMKDWRAAVRTWERSSSQKSSLYDKCVQNGLRFLEGFDD